MSILAILVVIIVVLFAMTYITKRRFGVLGLALCAGYLISEMWTAEVTPFIRGAGFDLFVPPLSSVVAACLVLIPPVVLLFNGPTYSYHWQRLLGAAVFALLAASFLLGPLGTALNLDQTGQTIYTFLSENKTFIITAGIAYAIYDVLILRTPKHHKR